MKEKFKNAAVEYFMNGYSCSESIVKASIEFGFASDVLLPVATPFSGGMGTGCLCGAISGAQIVIGFLFGRGKDDKAREYAKKLIEEFKDENGATCCRVLTRGLDFHSPERKQHCVKMVDVSASILFDIISSKVAVK